MVYSPIIVVVVICLVEGDNMLKITHIHVHVHTHRYDAASELSVYS